MAAVFIVVADRANRMQVRGNDPLAILYHWPLWIIRPIAVLRLCHSRTFHNIFFIFLIFD